MADRGTDLGERSRPAAILAALGSVSGLRIVDVGCGEGQIAIRLAEAGARVQGYDPFIAEGEVVAAGGGQYRLSAGRAQALPEPDGSADAVVFCYSLHHIPAPHMREALAEARRILKPGGRLLVAEPVAEGPAQYVMAPFHDESEVRAQAQGAIRAEAPAFASEERLTFFEVRHFASFDEYAAQAIANMRYNGYTETDVLTPEVERRFRSVADGDGARLPQPAQINLFR